VNLPRIILLAAAGLIIVGFAVVIIGSNAATSQGCFLWPLPVIIFCGAGTGSGSYLVLAIGLVAVAVISLVSFLTMRKDGP